MTKILYVEDDRDIAQAVKIILTSINIEVDLASCGKDAIKMAQNEYDLILLDVKLQDMTGWDIYEKLKKKHAKFAFLSIFPVPQKYREDVGKGKIVDYIFKPFIKDDLVNRLQKAIVKRPHRQ